MYIYKLILTSIIFILIYSCNNIDKTDNNIQKETIPINDSIDQKIKIISQTESLLQQMGLINIKDSLPEIIINLKYSGADNFIGIDFYGELTQAYTQPECFEKLKSAYYILQKENPGYTFIIYDAVRSIEAQKLMWDSLKVPQNQKFWYVADPQKGSIHNYGMALDLSIVDNNGNILDMGTEFDYFGELAYPDKTDYYYNNGNLTKEHADNRNLLFTVMKKAGFYVSKTEWWHFNASTLDYAKSNYRIFSIENINNN